MWIMHSYFNTPLLSFIHTGISFLFFLIQCHIVIYYGYTAVIDFPCLLKFDIFIQNLTSSVNLSEVPMMTHMSSYFIFSAIYTLQWCIITIMQVICNIGVMSLCCYLKAEPNLWSRDIWPNMSNYLHFPGSGMLFRMNLFLIGMCD